MKTSEPEVEKYLIGKLMDFCNRSSIFIFCFLHPGSPQNHFYPGMSIYFSIGRIFFQKSLAPSLVNISKKQDMTSITELYSLYHKHIFDFRFRCFQLPVSEKQPISGLRSEPEIKKLTMHQFRVNCIHPPSFIQIGPRVQEELTIFQRIRCYSLMWLNLRPSVTV